MLRVLLFVLSYNLLIANECFEFSGLVSESSDTHIKLVAGEELLTFYFKKNVEIQVPERLFVRLRAYKATQTNEFETDAKSIDIVRRNVASSYPSVKFIKGVMSKDKCLVHMK